LSATSAIYAGPVTHRRVKPRVHDLRYRVFMVLLDLDALAATLGRLKWLGGGRFGLLSFRAADHGDGSGDLAAYVRRTVSAAGLDATGTVQLLCMPRILGYGFNPLSLYFCHDAGGHPSAILYEVRNTFGQSHAYLIATPENDEGRVRQTVPKRFYVSPFMDMDLTYGFTVTPPGQRVGVDIAVSDGEGLVLTASFHGTRSDLTDANLLRAWFGHPLLTFKVMAGIHWEAIKIVTKGIRFRSRPALPDAPVTIGRPVPVISE